MWRRLAKKLVPFKQRNKESEKEKQIGRERGRKRGKDSAGKGKQSKQLGVKGAITRNLHKCQGKKLLKIGDGHL